MLATSVVAPLRAFEPASFAVNWSGTDTGSGIAGYDVFVSDNGGAFSLLTNTTQTSTPFNGINGHTYGFYTVAIDTAGRRETKPAAAEATTRVDAVAPTSSVNPLPGTSSSLNFRVSWSGQDEVGGSGIDTFDIFYSDNGGPLLPFVLRIGADAKADFPGQPGHTYALYSVATDRAGNRQATPTTTQAITTTPLASTNVSAVSGRASLGGAATLTATLASGGTPLAGKAVNFTLTTNGIARAVGSSATNSAGVATLNGVSIDGLGAGSYLGAVGASFAGDAANNGSGAVGDLTVVDPAFPNRSNPTITWANPADVVFPTPLGRIQFNATASVPGTFAYTPATGTVLDVGQGQILTARFTPTDTDRFNVVTATVRINVNPRPGTPGTNPPGSVPLVTVQGVQWENRRLSRRRTVRVLAVRYSDPVDPNSSQNLGAYRLVTAGRDRRIGTRDDRGAAFRSATYDAATRTVTLTPRARVLPRGALQLTIIAASILDTQQRPIDGNRDGQPGGDYLTPLRR